MPEQHINAGPDRCHCPIHGAFNGFICPACDHATDQTIQQLRARIAELERQNAKLRDAGEKLAALSSHSGDETVELDGETLCVASEDWLEELEEAGVLMEQAIHGSPAALAQQDTPSNSPPIREATMPDPLQQIALKARDELFKISWHTHGAGADAARTLVILDAMQQAQQIERERCVRVVEDHAASNRPTSPTGHAHIRAAEQIAAAIRHPEDKEADHG